MSAQCLKCGNTLRPGAKFCPQCGQTVASPSPPPYSPPTRRQALTAAQQAGQVARQAAAVAAPVVQAAGGVAWQASRPGMGWFARLITLGGRAAYAQVFDPPSLAEGLVIAQSAAANAPVPVEPSAFVFVLAFLIWPAIFWLPSWPGQLIVFLITAVVLLALNLAGQCWPAFSWLTWGRLLGRYRGEGVPELRFQLNDARQGLLNVRVVGPRHETMPLAVSHLVRVYGLSEPGRNELRAWKVDIYAASGQPLGIITASRPLPLVAMLLAPTLVWFIIWLIIWMV